MRSLETAVLLSSPILSSTSSKNGRATVFVTFQMEKTFQLWTRDVERDRTSRIQKKKKFFGGVIGNEEEVPPRESCGGRSKGAGRPEEREDEEISGASSKSTRKRYTRGGEREVMDNLDHFASSQPPSHLTGC